MILLVDVQFLFHLGNLDFYLLLLLCFSDKPLLVSLLLQRLKSEGVVSKWVLNVSKVGLVRDHLLSSIVAP